MDKLVYSVKIDRPTLNRALRLFKLKRHAGYYFEVEEEKDGMFLVRIFKG